MTDAGGGIDEEGVCLLGDAQLPAARGMNRPLVSRGAMNCRLVARPAGQPRHGRALGVEIHNSRGRTACRIAGGDIGDQRRLAATALGVEDDYPVQIVSSRRSQHSPVTGVPLTVLMSLSRTR